MRYAIIGSRGFNDYERLKDVMDRFDDVECVVSGGARGADSLGERYADERDVKTMVFKPDWERYGRAAGMVRNTEIIDNSDVVIAFWDGESRGTKDSITKARKKGKVVKVYKY